MLYCDTEEREQLRSHVARPLHTYRDFAEATESPGTAGVLVRWLLNTGRLSEFRLAIRLTRREEAQGNNEKATRALGERQGDD
jgi:hypothetical protein